VGCKGVWYVYMNLVRWNTACGGACPAWMTKDTNLSSGIGVVVSNGHWRMFKDMVFSGSQNVVQFYIKVIVVTNFAIAYICTKNLRIRNLAEREQGECCRFGLGDITVSNALLPKSQ
jgi:hypothetical protein